MLLTWCWLRLLADKGDYTYTGVHIYTKTVSLYIRAHYVRERMRAGDLHYTYISTNENIAGCMTKNSHYPAFKKFRAAMGVA